MSTYEFPPSATSRFSSPIGQIYIDREKRIITFKQTNRTFALEANDLKEIAETFLAAAAFLKEQPGG